ncbi:DNase I-like protein [Astrocystis sublimbata]|nr:DNase I-like protein [Astrocystis sublimbata]
MKLVSVLAHAYVAVVAVSAKTIRQIVVDHYLSPWDTWPVTDVKGVVTVKGPEGIWIREVREQKKTEHHPKKKKPRLGLYVYGPNLAQDKNIATGDVIVVEGKVVANRTGPNDLPLTQIENAKLTKVTSHNYQFEPVELATKEHSPPSIQLSSLDHGNVYKMPFNRTRITRSNPKLKPKEFGMDFWQSLVSQYVIIKEPQAVGPPNEKGDTWIVGNWFTNKGPDNGVNERDGNPEAILIGAPLDGTINPKGTKMGDKLEAIKGVVTQSGGFYRILPLTKLNIVSSREPAVAPPSILVSEKHCEGITVASYNVVDLHRGDMKYVNAIASDIVNLMRSPDLIALQGINDDSGPLDDGVIDCKENLVALTNAIWEVSGRSANYSYTYINSPNNHNGGPPGTNLRNAYIYRPDILQLQSRDKVVRGSWNETTKVQYDTSKFILYRWLDLNPGFIDPTNRVWLDTPKPLFAAWEIVKSAEHKGDTSRTLFTLNLDLAPRAGSSSMHGDARPPPNAHQDQRIKQAHLVGKYMEKGFNEPLDYRPLERIVALGSFYDHGYGRPVHVFRHTSHLHNLSRKEKIKGIERYTHFRDGTAVEYDHMFVNKIPDRVYPNYTCVHANTWASNDGRTSTHDPIIAKINVLSIHMYSGSEVDRETLFLRPHGDVLNLGLRGPTRNRSDMDNADETQLYETSIDDLVKSNGCIEMRMNA